MGNYFSENNISTEVTKLHIIQKWVHNMSDMGGGGKKKKNPKKQKTTKKN